MRTRHIFPVSAAAAAAAAATLLSACSPAPEPDQEPATEPVTAVTSRPPEETPSAAPRDPATVFADVLANPATVPVNPGAQFEPTGTYSYAFTDFTGDSEQDMLLREDNVELSPVILIRAVGSSYVPASQVLLDGATSLGARSAVLASDSGDGVFEQTTGRDGPGSATTHWRMEGDTLANVGETAHEPGTGIPGATEVTWLDTATGEPAQSETAVPAPPAAENHPQVTGTLTFMTNEEMMRGEPMPHGENPLQQADGAETRQTAAAQRPPGGLHPGDQRGVARHLRPGHRAGDGLEGDGRPAREHRLRRGVPRLPHGPVDSGGAAEGAHDFRRPSGAVGGRREASAHY